MTRKSEKAKLVLPIGKRDHIQGPTKAPVALVEYGDYECSHCGEAYRIVKQIQRKLGHKLCFVFRNFPLTRMHANAQHAAETAEAAAAQGKFWEMHDYLFEHQSSLDDEHLRKYVIALGLDVTRFDKEMKKHAYAARVREDFLSGVKGGVNGTPTFFINGVRYDGSWDLENLLKALIKRK